jgi:hypothetical protein
VLGPEVGSYAPPVRAATASSTRLSRNTGS